MQGLYGPFTFSEKLLQQIWARGDFYQTDLRTTDGRCLQVLQAGRWNRLGGPDFKAARLRFDDGREITAAVELHLRADDWIVHRHAQDRAYDQVKLHVVLFPPATEHSTRDAQGRKIPVLLPLLHHDLEEYAAEAAIEGLAGRPLAKAVEGLRHFSPAELQSELWTQAESRWRQKVHFALLRITKLGWEQACHHAALEILGYRFNRAPMLKLAARYPLSDWVGGVAAADYRFAEEQGQWCLQGVRPANHPRMRLRQYAVWAAAMPDWPKQLLESADQLPLLPTATATAKMRRQYRLGALRTGWARRISTETVGGTRLDNLVCDGWLPLLTACTGRNLGGLWQHWFPGDLPPSLTRALRELGVFAGRNHPACLGTVQGLLGHMLVQEMHNARGPAESPRLRGLTSFVADQ